MLLFPPLYGSRDAPLRWYITISAVLRQYGFVPLKTDHCAFGRHVKVPSCSHPLAIDGRRVSALILLHVDDIISVGSEEERRNFVRFVGTFNHGPIEELSVSNGLTYCGIDISVTVPRCLILSQKSYYQKIGLVTWDTILASNGKLLPSPKHITISKRFVGGCLWLFHTRFDVVFQVSQLASLVNKASSSVDALKNFTPLAKKVMSRIIDQHIEIKYLPLVDDFSLRPPQVIAFPDS